MTTVLEDRSGAAHPAPAYAIFGASGAVGRSVAATLRQRGERYRVIGRSRAALERLFGADPLAEIVAWNPEDPESVFRAASVADTVFDVVGGDLTGWSALPGSTRAIVEGAVRARVRRIVLTGTVLVYGRPQTPRIAESHPRAAETVKGRIRIEQEDIVLRAHAEGRIEAAILRIPSFYGPGLGVKSLLDEAFKSAVKGGRALLVAPIEGAFEFVYVPDVGPVLVALAHEPGAAGRALNLAGAGVTTQREMAALAFATTGRRLRILPVGPTLTRIASLFDARLRAYLEMLYLHTSPVLLDDSALTTLLGPIAKTSYADGVRQTVEALTPPTPPPA